jgi:inhibitor of KinA
MKTDIQIYPLSEKAVTIEVGNSITEEIHYKILSLNQFIHQLYIPGFIETVPSYCTLTIYYNPVEAVKKISESSNGIFNWMKNYLENELTSWQPGKFLVTQNKTVEIPVCYDEEYGTDLNDVAVYHNTTKEEIIRIHTAGPYHVFMMGFSPGFPYLGVLPDNIATPRKKQPALKIPAGSVAIAGNQTGIYPIESPGGWNIIGRTPLQLFNKENENSFLLKAGDSVKFVPVTKEYFIEHKQP